MEYTEKIMYPQTFHAQFHKNHQNLEKQGFQTITISLFFHCMF